ncbi:CD320 antigen, partial [Pongo abelii]|uniref:CD320 antigen n=1 Tax=Pongo abelii TaxID=9601 RepID=UPI003004269A
ESSLDGAWPALLRGQLDRRLDGAGWSVANRGSGPGAAAAARPRTRPGGRRDPAFHPDLCPGRRGTHTPAVQRREVRGVRAVEVCAWVESHTWRLPDPPGAGKEAGTGLSTALPGSIELRDRVASPSSGSCPPTKFQCRTSGLCVPFTWRCDRDLDCSDGSDEEECRIEPCTQNGQCPPPPGLPCPCTGVSDCSGGTDKKPRNCSRLACPAGELRCTLSDDCIPLTWRCDGHPDCPDSSDELGCGTNEILPEGDATTMGPPVTLESVTSVGNATSPSAGDQSGSPAAYGVIAAAAVLSASLVAATLLLLSWLRAQERLRPLGLLVAMKESLLLSERKTSLP